MIGYGLTTQRNSFKGYAMYNIYAMSTVCRKKDGYGLFIYVTGGDHNPPHAHITDLEDNELAKMIITDETPQSVNQLFRVKGTTSLLNAKQKKAIVQWANSKCKIPGLQMYTNWQRTQIEWYGENSEDDIFPSIDVLTLPL